MWAIAIPLHVRVWRYAGALLLLAYSASAVQVTVSPGEDLEKKVALYPAGTTFVLASGIHRMQHATPKAGDVFIGEPGAVMNGALLLSTFRREGSLWTASVRGRPGQIHGQCDSSHPRCNYPEDLFVNDARLLAVGTAGDVRAGEWFLDYDAGKLYLGEDPAGRRVELGVQRNAFFSQAQNVVIRGLTIEKYASPAQMGAIGDQYPGAAWTIENCEIRFNHGVGVNVAGTSRVLRNNIHHNGQMGLRGTGPNILIEGNEIGYNNGAGFDAGWEAGGFKFQKTSGLVVRGNLSHHNNGHGMWTDIDNINTLYEGNTVRDNGAGGIAHEISYAAVIRNNLVSNNGPADCIWLWASQIQIQNSQKVSIYDNTVVTSASTCGNAIGLIHQARGDGEFGPYVTRDNKIFRNLIVERGSSTAAGAVADHDAGSVFDGNNTFDANVYLVPDIKVDRWYWGGRKRTWDDFRQLGHENNGQLALVRAGESGSGQPRGAE
jgi:parallel beta-helix repeat protein